VAKISHPVRFRCNYSEIRRSADDKEGKSGSCLAAPGAAPLSRGIADRGHRSGEDLIRARGITLYMDGRVPSNTHFGHDLAYNSAYLTNTAAFPSRRIAGAV